MDEKWEVEEKPARFLTPEIVAKMSESPRSTFDAVQELAAVAGKLGAMLAASKEAAKAVAHAVPKLPRELREQLPPDLLKQLDTPQAQLSFMVHITFDENMKEGLRVLREKKAELEAKKVLEGIQAKGREPKLEPEVAPKPPEAEVPKPTEPNDQTGPVAL